MSKPSKQPKACPFDHPIVAGSSIDSVNEHFQGACHDCGAHGPEAGSYAEALKSWNARRTDGKQ